jgi:hypothetical protein
VVNISAPASHVSRWVAVRLALAVAAVATCSGVHAGTVDARPAISHTFRLGTAASPFSPAKQVGDFDHDGHPDVAAVDRVSARGGETHYALEIDLANGATENIAFSSAQPALDVALADIDHDGDLDIVVTQVLSRAIVGVWINDGTGRFAQAIIGPGSAPTLPSSIAQTLSPDVQPAPVLATASRAVFAGESPLRTSARARTSARVLSGLSHHPGSAGPFPFGSRAPPALTSIS